MVWQLARAARKGWRGLNASELLANVVEGVVFTQRLRSAQPNRYASRQTLQSASRSSVLFSKLVPSEPASPSFACAVKRPTGPMGDFNPIRQLLLRPVAIEATASGNGAVGAFGVKGLHWEISKRAGRNASEHHASLETGDADADLVRKQGKLSGRGSQAEEPVHLPGYG